MDTMQFRDYVFDHNPASIEIGDSSQVSERFCPGRGFHVRNLGKKSRVVKCRGSFLGTTSADALDKAAAFRRSGAENRAGMLFVPGLPPFPAHLREFALDLSGDGRVLPYTIVFVEQEAT